MLLLDKPATKVPFTLIFSEKIEPSLYIEAIKDSQKLADTYNPETQTSNPSIYAGTELTYETSTSGPLGRPDDTEQTDT